MKTGDLFSRLERAVWTVRGRAQADKSYPTPEGTITAEIALSVPGSSDVIIEIGDNPISAIRDAYLLATEAACEVIRFTAEDAINQTRDCELLVLSRHPQFISETEYAQLRAKSRRKVIPATVMNASRHRKQLRQAVDAMRQKNISWKALNPEHRAVATFLRNRFVETVELWPRQIS